MAFAEALNHTLYLNFPTIHDVSLLLRNVIEGAAGGAKVLILSRSLIGDASDAWMDRRGQVVEQEVGKATGVRHGGRRGQNGLNEGLRGRNCLKGVCSGRVALECSSRLWLATKRSRSPQVAPLWPN